ncbi:hypothetical protein [Modestobacter sp. SYSU DS0511]
MTTGTAAPSGASAVVQRTGRRAPDGPGRRRTAEWLLGAATYGGHLVVQVVQLLVLHQLAPRFFWLDDSQSQFGPMTWWMGRNQQDGRPPLMDPDLGQAGNLVADMQYGALDPLHWGLQALAAQTDDLLLMSWLFGGGCVLGLGTGALVLLRHHGVPRPLAVAGAVGIASSGFFLWYGSSWWPLMWSVAWLPWFWWGLATRRWWGAAVLALATWALLTSGNPYVLFFALAIIVAQAVERVRAAGSVRALLGPADAARALALFGGLAVALPTLLSTVELSPYMSRQGAEPVIGNAGFGVPNLADVVLGGATLMGQTNAWTGAVQVVPAMATLVVALPALALVRWRTALRHPGVLTALAVYVLAVVLTQLPTTVSVFRYPFRYLVIVQVMLPLLALIAVTAAPALERKRLRLALLIVGAQALLAWFRAPLFVRWHVLAGVLAVVALGCLVVALRRRPPWATVAAGALVALSAGSLFLGVGMMLSVQERADVLEGATSETEGPFRSLPPGRELGTTEADYRANALVTDGVATVITTDFGPAMGWPSGVLRGNGNLVAGFATGGGSLAVWQRGVNEHWCRDYDGTTCGEPESLLARAPGTGLAWVDLLSSDRVLLGTVPQAVRDHFESTWTPAGRVGDLDAYVRRDDLPGRVTAARDVSVTQQPGHSGLAHGGEPMDVYTVSTGASPGTVVTRIPYWPGLRATVDGAPVEVGAIDDAVLSLELPAGLRDARLEISYVPVGERLLVPAFVVGGVLTAAAVLTALIADRRSRRRPAAAAPADDGAVAA